MINLLASKIAITKILHILDLSFLYGKIYLSETKFLYFFIKIFNKAFQKKKFFYFILGYSIQLVLRIEFYFFLVKKGLIRFEKSLFRRVLCQYGVSDSMQFQ